ncbi:MAG TPA: hypothetical protein VHH73_09385 [Verrucomicrobiae bacterium]|nr:hypothetical protein [Verrucomicrobiae bacterium]
MKDALRLWILGHCPQIFAMRLAAKESMGRISFERTSFLTPDEARNLDQKFGNKVLAGPFKGMVYTEEPICSEKWPKLIGSYEDELTPLLEKLVAKRFKLIIDVGCAEGFYAVGFAYSCPGTRVIAVDPLEEAGKRLERLGRANGVADRIKFCRILSPGGLDRMVEDSTLIVMDCEGAELGLLNPASQRNLTKAEVIVEVHDFVRPGLTEELARRFSPTHECQVIQQERRDPKAYPCLASVDPALQSKLLDEHRPGRLRWLHMAPR